MEENEVVEGCGVEGASEETGFSLGMGYNCS